MKRFMAVYIGTPEGMARWNARDEADRSARQAAGMEAWKAWAARHADDIVDAGGPLGRTKSVSPEGLRDVRNALAAYVVVQAESHEAAARMFEGHPHFTFFPGDSVEIMECLPMPPG